MGTETDVVFFRLHAAVRPAGTPLSENFRWYAAGPDSMELSRGCVSSSMNRGEFRTPHGVTDIVDICNHMLVSVSSIARKRRRSAEIALGEPGDKKEEFLNLKTTLAPWMRDGNIDSWDGGAVPSLNQAYG